jgi:ribosomal protein L2
METQSPNIYTSVVSQPKTPNNHKLKISSNRSTSTGKVGHKAKYPRFTLSEQHAGEVIDLVHERGREAPLAKVRFEDGSVSFVPAAYLQYLEQK